jgi:hypothetical protein
VYATLKINHENMGTLMSNEIKINLDREIVFQWPDSSLYIILFQIQSYWEITTSHLAPRFSGSFSLLLPPSQNIRRLSTKSQILLTLIKYLG